MGFDASAALDSAASWLCSSRLVNRVVSNPIFAALLITAMAMVVIMSVFGYCARKAGWRKIARVSIYLLLVVSAVVFVHHYASLHRMRTEVAHQGARDVFNELGASVVGRGEHPVLSHPTRSGGDDGYRQTDDNQDDLDDGDVTGGADGKPCPCRGAPAVVGAASSPNQGKPRQPLFPSVRPQSRPDNIDLGDGLSITDVIVPTTGATA